MKNIRSFIQSILKENIEDFLMSDHPDDLLPAHIIDVFVNRIVGLLNRGFDEDDEMIEALIRNAYKANGNKIPERIKQLLNIDDKFVNESDVQDYHGEHSAPSKSDDGSYGQMHDLTSMYGGEDIYTSNAYKYFAQDDPLARQAINLIQYVRNKPNALVKVYRAIPNFNADIDKKVRELDKLLSYHNKFGFFPLKNSLIYSLEDKYENLEYDQQQKAVYNDIADQIEKLIAQKSKLPKINNGDWVTTIRQYAVDHGKNELNNSYKILSKTVRAKDLYNSGDSVLEYGYSY